MKSDVTRRSAIVATSGSIAFGSHDANAVVDPITVGTVLIWVGKWVGIGVLSAIVVKSLEELTNPKRWEKSTRRPDEFHDKGNLPYRVKPEHRRDVDVAVQGGRITCDSEGHLIGTPAGTSPRRYSDLSLPEALLCQKDAPFAIAPRKELDQNSTAEKNARILTENHFQEPLKRMNYVRTMFDSTGKELLLLNGRSRDESADLYSLWEIRGAQGFSFVSAIKTTDWLKNSNLA